jgi:hypothetical protein
MAKPKLPKLPERVIDKVKTVPPTAAVVGVAAGALVLAGVLWRRGLARVKS